MPLRAVVLTLLATALAGRVAAEPPRLVVLVSVDQLRADYLERGRELWSGGLKRLLDDGAWFRNAAFPYSHTVTCAGHASISTGTVPARHGMVLNAWFDRSSASSVRCTEDASLRRLPVGGAPAAEGPGEGPGRLLVPTLGDLLRLEREGRVASFSLKARSAIGLAGQRADAIAWFEGGHWTTSTHYGPAPGFLVDLARVANPVSDAGRVWERLLPAERYAGSDASAFERPPPGWSDRFPHAVAAAGQPGLAGQWSASPFADAAVARLALGALRGLELGSDPGRTDLLAVSFSALDYAGHAYGPHSHEVQDLLLHLDATVGELLQGIDASVGEGRWVLALSADHGVAPIPELVAERGLDAGRIEPAVVAAKLESALAGLLGAGKRVASATHTDLYLEPGVWDELRDSPAALELIRSTVLATPGVERVYDRDQLAEGGADLDAIGRRVALSFHPERSGDLVMVWKPYWLSSSAGSTHGTPRGYDRRVPVVLFGPGVVPGARLEPATPLDIVPTLALLVGVTPSESDGRVLIEALR